MANRPSIPAEVSRQVLIESGHCCAVCGTSSPLERAHIVAWCNSKDHTPDNLICLCANCHERADRERWGEPTLREYKRIPWVGRKYTDRAAPQPNKKRVKILIDYEYENWDQSSNCFLQHAIAGFLRIPPELVKLKSVSEGSVRIVVMLPEVEAEQLVRAHDMKDPKLSEQLAPLSLLGIHRDTESDGRLGEAPVNRPGSGNANHGSEPSQEVEETGDAQPQDPNDLELGLVGLIDAGKSTLLARLYAQGHQQDGARGPSRLTLSFPCKAFGSSDATLTEVVALWEHVRKHFDQKKKTIKGVKLHFTVQGPGIPKPLHFVTHDVPGEVFGPSRESAHDKTSGQPRPSDKTLERLWAYFDKHLPQMAGLLVLVEFGKRHDEASMNIVRDSVRKASERKRKGGDEPVFVLVIFTKAASVKETDLEGLPQDRSALDGLEKDLREIHPWIKVVACESLGDLIKDTEEGLYKLPPPNVPRASKPEWVLTPTQAVLSLPEMVVKWRRRQRLLWWLRVGIAATVLLSIWLWSSWLLDNEIYSRARNVPLISERIEEAQKGLEDYYFGFKQPFYKAFSRHKHEARERWQQAWRIEREEVRKKDLEQALRRCIELSTGPLAPLVDLTELEDSLVQVQAEKEQLEKDFEQTLVEWEGKVFADGHFLRDPIEAGEFQRIPTSWAKWRNRQDDLQREYDEAESKVSDFKGKLAKIEEFPLVREALADLQKLPTPRFADLRGQAVGELATLVGKIRTLGIPTMPKGAFETIEEVEKLVGQRKEFSTPETKVSLDAGRQEVMKRIEEIQKRDTANRDRYHSTLPGSWGDALKVCEQANSELLDLDDTKKWWTAIEHELQGRINGSTKDRGDLANEIETLKSDPQKQINPLMQFEEDSLRHSPEDRAWASGVLVDLRAQKVELDDKYKWLLTANEAFRSDRKRFLPMETALNDYLNTLSAQGRSYVDGQRTAVAEIELAASQEQKIVGELREEVRALIAGLGQAADPDQRLKTFRDAAEKLRDYLSTYEYDTVARRSSENWRGQLIAAANGKMRGPSDLTFKEAYDLWTLLATECEALGFPGDLKTADDKGQRTRDSCAQAIWNKTQQDAIRASAKLDYPQACQILDEYMHRAGTAWFEIRLEDANNEFEKTKTKWIQSTLAYFRASIRDRRLSSKEAFRRQLKDVRGRTDAFKEVIGDTPATISEEAMKTVEILHEMLVRYYEARINRVLSSCPKPKGMTGRVVLDRWEVMDKLMAELAALEGDEDMKGVHPDVCHQAARILTRLEGLKTGVNVILRLKRLDFVSDDIDIYTGPWKNWPKPRFQLVAGGNTLWHVDLKDHGSSNQATSSRKVDFIYSVASVKVGRKSRLAAYGIETHTEDKIRWEPSQSLLLRSSLGANKHMGAITMELVRPTETPGVLLLREGYQMGSSFRVAGQAVPCDIAITEFSVTGAEAYSIEDEFTTMLAR